MDTERLQPLIGSWSMGMGAPPDPDAVGAETVFAWLEGRRFVIQRWQVPHPEAPDGIAVIGFDAERGTFLQHYFDSRGVARLYVMSFENGVWKLSRTAADFTPLSFAQRFTGALSEDGATIAGRWEKSSDGGSSWELDFELFYVRRG